MRTNLFTSLASALQTLRRFREFPHCLSVSFHMKSPRGQRGTGLIEYVVLVAFLAFILVGVLTEIGRGASEKLCYASLSHNGGDINGDGQVDPQDLGLFVADQSNKSSDYDCDGVVEYYNTSGTYDGSWGRQGDDYKILYGWSR